jgi:hypothetical protein
MYSQDTDSVACESEERPFQHFVYNDDDVSQKPPFALRH